METASGDLCVDGDPLLSVGQCSKLASQLVEGFLLCGKPLSCIGVSLLSGKPLSWYGVLSCVNPSVGKGFLSVWVLSCSAPQLVKGFLLYG